MTIQIRKTYRGVNPEMVRDEVRDLVQKEGITVDDTKVQTYPLPSGATQSRATMVFRTKAERPEDQQDCGRAHIIGSPLGETKLLLDIDENHFPKEKLSSFQGNLDFILGSYELKW